MTLEEAVEEVLRGDVDGSVCRACGGSGSNFKGGMEVGYASIGEHMMHTGTCRKCGGLGKTVGPIYAEARRVLGLPPVRPR